MKTIPNLNTCIDKYLKTHKPFQAGDIISIESKLYIIEKGNDSCDSCDLNSLSKASCSLWKLLNNKYKNKGLICSEMLPHCVFKELKGGL